MSYRCAWLYCVCVKNNRAKFPLSRGAGRDRCVCVYTCVLTNQRSAPRDDPYQSKLTGLCGKHRQSLSCRDMAERRRRESRRSRSPPAPQQGTSPTGAKAKGEDAEEPRPAKIFTVDREKVIY